MVTDRVELDTQIYGTFAGVGAVTNKKAQAKNGNHMEELLSTDEKYIFTLIHKFNFDKEITERENIIVISDEAHRTQGGTLAINMRKALHNTSFIGFPGHRFSRMTNSPAAFLVITFPFTISNEVLKTGQPCHFTMKTGAKN